MIKANQIAVIEKPAKISPSFLKWYTSYVANEYVKYETAIKRSADSIEEYKRRTEVEERHREELIAKWKTMDKEKDKEEAEAIKKRLEHIWYVDKVEVSSPYIYIHTKLLFTDIRLADGSRVSERTCIGAFCIKIAGKGGTTLGVEQQLFTHTPYDHWSVKLHKPCLGDWRDQFMHALQNGDIVEVVTLLLPYLKSTNDGSAYKRSHQWKATDRYREVSDFHTGDFMQIKKAFEYDGAVFKKGQKARVIEDYGGFSNSGNDIGNLHFKSGVCNRLGVSMSASNQWQVPMIDEYFMKITEAQYLKSTAVPVPKKKKTKLQLIDELPKGSTLEDALKILNS